MPNDTMFRLTKEMKLNEEETEFLFNYLNEETHLNYKITDPPVRETPKEVLDAMFGGKGKGSAE